jgi:hypothetical protein
MTEIEKAELNDGLGRHPTTLCSHPGGEEIGIDTRLAPLIRSLWRLAIQTSACCQEAELRKGKAYIAFETIKDAERFLGLAAGAYSEDLESLYNRVVFHGSLWKSKAWAERRRFHVECWAKDWNMDYEWNEETQEGAPVVYGPPRIELGVVVLFPTGDIDAVTERFAELVEPLDVKNVR